MTTGPLRGTALVGSLLLAACITEPEEPDGGGEFLGVLSGPSVHASGRPIALDVSSTGRVVVTRQDLDLISFFDVDATELDLHAASGDAPGDVIFTPDGGHVLVTALDDHTLREVNATTGATTRSLTIGFNPFRILTSANGSRIFVTSAAGALYAVDRSTFLAVDSVALGGSVEGIARHPTTGQVVVSSTSGGVWIIDPVSLDVVASIGLGVSAKEVLVHPNGQEIFVALQEASKVMVLDANTLAKVDSVMFDGFADSYGMAISPNGETLLVGSVMPNFVAIVDVATRTVTRLHGVLTDPRRMRFTPDGSRAFVAMDVNLVLRLR